MRDKKTIRQCKDGHKGEFEKLNENFYLCKTCGAIIGKELIKK